MLDEAWWGWLFLDHPLFATKIREWLKTLRKRNVSVVFATQSMADIADHPVAPTIIEGCMTKVLLPNAAATEPTTRRVYEDLLGFGDKQLRVLATATPKRHYYYTSGQGSRLIDLDLSRTELALLASSTPAKQSAARRLHASVPPGGFCEAWLRQQNLSRSADEAAEAGRHAARLVAIDKSTAEAIDIAARTAAERARREVLAALREMHPFVADELEAALDEERRPAAEAYPDPNHADVPPAEAEATNRITDLLEKA